MAQSPQLGERFRFAGISLLLRVDGEARVIEPALTETSAEVARAFDLLRGKYSQYEHTSIVSGSPQLIAIRATATRSWCATGEAAPRSLPR